MLCYDSNVINILLQTYYGSDFLFVPIKLIPIFFFHTKKNVLLPFERGECRIAFICSNSDKRYWRLIVFFAKSMKYIMMPFAKIFYHRPFWRIICLPNFWQSLHNKQHERNLQQSLFWRSLGCRIETFRILPKLFSNGMIFCIYNNNFSTIFILYFIGSIISRKLYEILLFYHIFVYIISYHQYEI